MTNGREQHLKNFYELLDDLEQSLGGARVLSQCDGRMGWPQRGVYFFREPGETRSYTGSGPRIVRVGTHALKTGSGTKLWTRLSQHRGHARSGGGNHRGSINDDSGPDSLRGFVERNAIALLSNCGKEPLGSPSGNWLGRLCNRERVRTSGLWNQNHVDEQNDPEFLDTLARLIHEMGKAG
jgi:hypothetical protein